MNAISKQTGSHGSCEYGSVVLTVSVNISGRMDVDRCMCGGGGWKEYTVLTHSCSP